MPVDWERELPRLSALARLRVAPEEGRALAAACDAITRDFALLADLAAGLLDAPEGGPGPLREDVVAPADAAEIDGILAAAPALDASRAIIVPKEPR